MRRRWLVVILFAGEWKVHTRCWTKWGVNRKARCTAENGAFPGLMAPVDSLVGAVGYCHEGEFSDLPVPA